jgi:FKBP-type peptidyl-prolyl cis-trans isomerase
MLTRFVRPAALAVAIVLSAGCLDSSGPGEAVPIEKTDFASSLGVDLNASTKTANGAYYRDISVGTGAAITTGDEIDVVYTGWLSSGQQFETNAGGELLTFVLGASNIIEGFNETIPGMRVGGKRQLILPSSLAYGPYGFGPIPGNAVIVFNVEVVAAR